MSSPCGAAPPSPPRGPLSSSFRVGRTECHNKDGGQLVKTSLPLNGGNHWHNIYRTLTMQMRMNGEYQLADPFAMSSFPLSIHHAFWKFCRRMLSETGTSQFLQTHEKLFSVHEVEGKDQFSEELPQQKTTTM